MLPVLTRPDTTVPFLHAGEMVAWSDWSNVNRWADLEPGARGDEYQAFKANGGAYLREHFFGKYPELRQMVAHMSDDEIYYDLVRGERADRRERRGPGASSARAHLDDRDDVAVHRHDVELELMHPQVALEHMHAGRHAVRSGRIFTRRSRTPPANSTPQ